MLGKVTSNDDAPVPGYVMNELTQALIKDPVKQSATTAKTLASSLSSSNHNVKWKTLSAIRHLSRQGPLEVSLERGVHWLAERDC